MLYRQIDQINTVLELNILWQIGTLQEPSWWAHWPGKIYIPFPNPREGRSSIDSQLVSTTASQHPFIHQRTVILAILCPQKKTNTQTLPELNIKIANIKTYYFSKSTSKLPVHNSWIFPAPQVSKVQLLFLILNKTLPLGQQPWSAQVSSNLHRLRALHGFLCMLGRKPNHGEKPTCCRKEN